MVRELCGESERGGYLKYLHSKERFGATPRFLTTSQWGQLKGKTFGSP